jgi:hypothetical protein
MKVIFTAILLNFITIINGYSCSCSEYSIEKNFIQSDFVAMGNIIRVFDKDSMSYKIEIKITKLFKGDSVNVLTVYNPPKNSYIQTSCDLYANVGETWLVMANKDADGLGFGYCSLSNTINKFSPSELLSFRNPKQFISRNTFSYTETNDHPIPSPQTTTILKNRFPPYKEITGKVFIQITISISGQIIDHKIVKSDNPKLNEKAIKILDSLDNWTPGKIKGESVNSEMIIPIIFDN